MLRAITIWLQRPMSHPNRPVTRLIQALFFGLFVFAFLYFFQPFQLDQTGSRLFSLSVGFGLVTTLSMLLLNVILPFLIPAFFSEKVWVVWRELLWTMVNISFIGLANHLYFSWVQTKTFQFHGLWWFQLATWSVGIFPVSLFVLLRERTERLKYAESSRDLTQHLHHTSEPVHPTQTLITLEAQNQGESIQIVAEDLLLIAAAENYIEVHYIEAGRLSKKLLRSTLKSAEDILSVYPAFFRCHKSYLVNLDRVSDISGNAQGYKLHIPEWSERIPVSRQYNEAIKQKLTDRP
jgi:hypothetical protein